MTGLRKRTEVDRATVVSWIPDSAALYRFAGPWLTWPLTADRLNDVAARPGATAWVLDSSDGLALEQARSQGASRVDLGVLADNWSARRIYDALGFVPTADPGPSGVIMMTRPL